MIVSVKEIEYKDTGDETGWLRWHRAAVEESAKQIWGAERWLRRSNRVLRRDGREIALPPESERKYHRLSISLGGRGEVPIRWGDLGHGFVHVLDEHSVIKVFRELDTITDFVTYLAAVEGLFDKGIKPVFSGAGYEDLLALYVRAGPTFGLTDQDGRAPDRVILTEGIWKALIASPEYIERNDDLRSSYAWDRLIEHFVDDLLTDGMFDMHSKQVTKDELAMVAMALQPRAHRANLADALRQFLGPDGSRIASRVVVAANGTAFVFVSGDSSDRDYRSKHLALRCFVVRGRSGATTVVGIATDRPGQVRDFPFWTHPIS